MPIVGTPGQGNSQAAVGRKSVGTLSLPGQARTAPNVTLTAAQQAWLQGHGGIQIGQGGTLHGPGTQVGTPPGTPPPGGSGSGSGSGNGDGSGSGAGAPQITLPPWPKFVAPSWWSSPPSPPNLNWVAGLIRNAFFAGLGSLDGYPYSTQQVYQAYLYPMLQSQNQTEPNALPATLTITIYDANGNQVSQDVVTMTQASATIAVPGTYSLTGTYTIEVIAGVGGAASLTSHYGPFTGAQMGSASSPVGFIVPYNPAGTAAGSFTFVNADGTPAVNVPIQIGVDSPFSATQTPSSLGAPANSQTNAKGQVTWAAQLGFLSPDGVYQVVVLVYSGTLNSDGTISGNLLGTWSSPDLTYAEIQGYTATINVSTLTPPPSGTAPPGSPAGRGTSPPPHHQKGT